MAARGALPSSLKLSSVPSPPAERHPPIRRRHVCHAASKRPSAAAPAAPGPGQWRLLPAGVPGIPAEAEIAERLPKLLAHRTKRQDSIPISEPAEAPCPPNVITPAAG